MNKFLLSLTLFTAFLGFTTKLNAQTYIENFTSTPVGDVPAGWDVSSNTSVQIYQRPGTCTVNDKGLQTPGVGKSAPIGMILPTLIHSNGSDIKIDFTIYVYDATLKCASNKPFPCATFVQAFLVPITWTDETAVPTAGQYYAALPDYQIVNANSNNTIIFPDVTLPAGITQYRVLLNFKAADNGNCVTGGTKFIFDDFGVTSITCQGDCVPISNADYFNADVQNLFQSGSTSFKANLYGGYAPWTNVVPAGFELASLNYSPAVNNGTDYDLSNSPLSAATFAFVPGSLIFVSGPACGINPSLGTVSLNANGTFTYTRGSVCVTRVTFKYTLTIGGVTTSPTLVTLDMPGEQIVLPVTYTSFNATRSSNSQVVLEWETAMEENNRGFHVQRLVNGEWKNIGFVFTAAEKGNSTSSLKYAFKDANSNKGITQYRILQVDMDGKGRYSEVRSIRGEEMAARLTIFPNPSNTGSFNLLFEDATSVWDVIVSDVSGRQVKQIRGISSNSISVDGLNNGFYTVQVVNHTTGALTVDKVIIKKR